MFESNPFTNIRMHTNVKVFYAVVQLQNFISLVSINRTQKQTQDVHLELLHHITIHPDETKSIEENEANKFCFVLTL